MSIKDLFRANDLSNKNKSKAEDIQKLHKKLTRKSRKLQSQYLSSLEDAWDDGLVPFSILFGQIKNCDLEQIALDPKVPNKANIDTNTVKFSLEAFNGLVALSTGATLGAGAGAATFAAVSSLAVASTGTAISTLSGAAATSATLAWLGGGSLAAGGGGVAAGTAVLGGLVALPVLVIAGWWLSESGSKELNKQEKVKQELRASELELFEMEALINDIEKIAKPAMKIVQKALQSIKDLNLLLRNTLEDKNDYLEFNEKEKKALASQINLSLALINLIATPLVEEEIDKHGKKLIKPNMKLAGSSKSVEALI